MNEAYEDIRDLIGQEPQWWDEHAVPRFCAFDPSRCADIYADEAALVEIRCQGCERSFHVAFTNSPVRKVECNGIDGPSLADEIRRKTLHYGAPPNVGCCAAGPTMSSVPVRVIGYWQRSFERSRFQWEPDPDLVADIVPDWAKDE